jgi:hypothetical protein
VTHKLTLCNCGFQFTVPLETVTSFLCACNITVSMIAGGFFLWCHSCAFSAVTRVLELPRLGCYFIVLLLSDVMTIHFFFLVSLPTFFPSRFHQCSALYLIALHLHEDQWRNLFFCSAICTDWVEHNLSKSDSWHNSLCVELRISLLWFH